MSDVISPEVIQALKVLGDYSSEDGLSEGETSIVQVKVQGGNLPEEGLVLYSIADRQSNPQEINGSKSFGVEQMDVVPYKQLTQTTRKDATWSITLKVDTTLTKYSKLIFAMDAGPYMLTFSAFKIPVKLKNLAFIQHSGREFWYTWTMDFEEDNAKPKAGSNTLPAESIDIAAIYQG